MSMSAIDTSENKEKEEKQDEIFTSVLSEKVVRPHSPVKNKLAIAMKLDKEHSPSIHTIEDLQNYISSEERKASHQAVLMIVSGYVADAASMPLHWIYDQNDVKNKIDTNYGEGAFYNPPSCPFYKYDLGCSSPYGDESIPILHSIMDTSDFNIEDAGQKLYDWAKSYPGRLNHAIKQFIDAHDEGKEYSKCASAESIDAHSLVKVPIIVARSANNPDLIAKIDASTHLLQLNPFATRSARLFGRLLEHVLLTGEAPATTIHVWALSEQCHLPDDEKKLIKFISSANKVKTWIAFYQKVVQVPKDTENPYFHMQVLRDILLIYIETGSLELALSDASLSEAHKALIQLANEQPEKETPKPLLRMGSSLKDVSSTSYAAVPRDAFPIALASFGLSCALPGALLSSLYICLYSKNMKEAIEANILCGGDSCSRSFVIGALFGASKANATYPVEYLAKMKPSVLEDIIESSFKIADTNVELNI